MNIEWKLLCLILLTCIFTSCGSHKKRLIVTNEYVSVEKRTEQSSISKISTYPELTKSDKLRLSLILKTPIKEISDKKKYNHKLYSYMLQWLGTPYLYGGEDKNGIDCSAFIQQLTKEVYGSTIGRTCDDMITDVKNIQPFKNVKALKEGDLIFFREGNQRITTHVGIYLKNNMFLSSTSSKGVSVANLNKSTWKKSYLVSGKLIN